MRTRSGNVVSINAVIKDMGATVRAYLRGSEDW